jgi:PAS domain S-box-containing protein
MRGVVVRTGKRLDEVGQRLATLFTRSFTSRDLQESKARLLEEAQRVAHIGYWVWNLDTARVTWSDEAYRIFGLEPQQGPIDMAMIREMIHPEDREPVFRTAEEAIRGGVRPDSEHRLVRPNGEVRTVHSRGEVKRDASGRPFQMFGSPQQQPRRGVLILERERRRSNGTKSACLRALQG